jgi:uncharacterized damage-inducible protein DinB
MNQQDILVLFRYNQWANGKILNAAATLPQELFLREASYPHSGLRGTLVHTLFAEWIWRSRWQGESPTKRFKTDEFPTFDSLYQRWMQEEHVLMGYVEGLTDDLLNQHFHYKTTRGEPRQQILWHTMLHVVNHGTQHRAEAAALLTDFGCSPGDVDMIYFLGG